MIISPPDLTRDNFSTTFNTWYRREHVLTVVEKFMCSCHLLVPSPTELRPISCNQLICIMSESWHDANELIVTWPARIGGRFPVFFSSQSKSLRLAANQNLKRSEPCSDYTVPVCIHRLWDECYHLLRLELNMYIYMYESVPFTPVFFFSVIE